MPGYFRVFKMVIDFQYKTKVVTQYFGIMIGMVDCGYFSTMYKKFSRDLIKQHTAFFFTDGDFVQKAIHGPPVTCQSIICKIGDVI